MRTQRIVHLIILLVSTSLLSHCGVLSQGSLVDVVTHDRRIETVNLARRHYKVDVHCRQMLNLARPQLIASLNSIPEHERTRLPWYSKLLAFKVSDCESFKNRGRIMGLFDDVYSDHSNRIGVILPPAAANEMALQAILGEFKATLKRNGVFDPESAVVVVRVAKNLEDATKGVAKLIHFDRVSLVVVINSQHAAAAIKLSDATQVPLLLVSPTSGHTTSRQSMRVYPSLQLAVEKLDAIYKGQSVSHVSIIAPRGGDLDLVRALKSVGGNRYIFMESFYNSDSPQDVLQTVKGAVSRMQLVRSNAQAVLILDNFKMVRHVVNMIRGATDQKLLITGNQQWRSPALTIPREEALEGALFVDYIGSYKNLPAGLEVPIPESEFFTTAQAASKIDYQLIGHRLGTLCVQVLKKPWSRQRIAVELQSMTNVWDNYFPVGDPAFDKSRDSSWPSYLFRVKGEAIELVTQ